MRFPKNIISTVAAALFTLAAVLCPSESHAQVQQLFDLLFKSAPVDSTKVEEPKKPLESYFFDDSTRLREVFAWRHALDRNSVELVPTDTMPDGFQVDYRFMQKNVGAAYLGHLGGATVPLNYFDRAQYRDFSFMHAFDAYQITPQRARYYNVKKPFTNLSYYMSGQKINEEQQLRAIHAQNISPSTGFNIEYLNRGTKGMYSSQRSMDKNLSLAFNHTGQRYAVHAGYIYNMGDIRENGGLQRDTDITDTIIKPPSNLAVRLTDAKNYFKGNTFYITQTYGIPLEMVYFEDFSIADKPSIFIGHAFEYTKYRKRYTDTKAKSGDYYEHWYYNPAGSTDSLSESKLDNKLFIQMQPWDRNSILGTLDAGMGYTMYQYYNFTPEDYLRGSSVEKRNDVYIYGALSGRFKRYAVWNAELKYHPMGDFAQNMIFKGDIRLSAYVKSRPVTLALSGYIETRSPSYWSENYRSNHFIWSNSFDKEIETRLEATLEIPSINLEGGIFSSMTTDKIYYADNAMPAQHSGTLHVLGFYGRKDFNLGALHLNHRALVQKSNNETVAPLPLLSAYAAWYVDFHVVRDILRIQLGAEGWYNTEYYAPAYNPATMAFHNQHEKKLGNYPYLAAFVSAKWARMRILVKFQHVNENLFGERNYFSVLHYPLNRRMFKLGFSWSFYD